MSFTIICNINLKVNDTSVAYIHPSRHISYIKINDNCELPAKTSSKIEADVIALPYYLYIKLQSPITVSKSVPTKIGVNKCKVLITAITSNDTVDINTDELESRLSVLSGTPTDGTRYMTVSRTGEIIMLTIVSDAGIFEDDLEFTFMPSKHPECKINITSNQSNIPTAADFYRHGVAGYEDVVEKLITNVILPWKTPKEVREGFNVKHTKGVLLYGIPGTGKTNIARAMAGILGINNKVKIINGPSIKSKWVGESESKLRNLFEEAKNDTKYMSNPPLHILIFDEIDAIAPSRGGLTEHNNSIVAQLLTMMDGVQSYDNVFIIGITNRKDSLDEAILRPGRLGFHLEIKIPDERQRYYIFRYHIDQISLIVISDDDIKKLAKNSNGLTGADIKDVVHRASNIALQRYHKGDKSTKVYMKDLEEALKSR